MATGAKLGFDPARFHIWKPPGNGFSIHLSLEVVHRLTQELRRAASENPPRDITGVLLGRARIEFQPSSVVEDFVLDRGNEADRAQSLGDNTVSDTIWKLVGAAGSGRHVVGFFRSQRDGLLIPNDWDLRNASRLFGEPDNLLLLIRFAKQGESDAAFVYWEPRKKEPYFSGPPFPFDLSKLAPASEFATKSSDSLPLNDPHRLPRPIPPPRTTVPFAWEPRIWLRLIPTFGLFALVTLGTQMLWSSHSAEATAPEMLASSETPIGLTVTARPHQVEIRWNHDSAPIRSAEKAVIKILEGSLTEVVPVARQDLQDGFVVYTPKTNDVNVRFEVTGSDGSRTTESVRVVAIP
jgi:hypothetical protein